MNFFTPSIQSYCLIAALMIYGVFSSPTPDTIGLPEISVALLLCLSFRVIKQDVSKFSFVALGYGIAIPTVTAFINGQNSDDIIRDIIPFLYLMLPLFLGWIGLFHPQRIFNALAFVGLVFSIRTLFSYRAILFDFEIWGQGPPADLLYLANSPEVLFSALYCIGQGGKMMLRNNQWVKGGLVTLLSLIPLLAMILMTQRAGAGAVIFYVMIALCIVLYRHPKTGALFLCLGTLGVFAGWTVIEHILFMMTQKTELVGLNTRTQEWAAVFDRLSSSTDTALWGEGWGGRIENPAVGGLNVNYTHSLLSSMLLKTGIVGSLVILTGCLMPVIKSARLFWTGKIEMNLVLLGAVLFPFLISVFLYASYKSLGFGLILLVFSTFSIRKLEKNPLIVP